MIHFSLHKKLHTADGEVKLHVDCQIQSGEFISLYGPSGVGKTSILRMLAGLLKPNDGFIKMDGVEWYNQEKHIDIIPQHRQIGFVFQDYALFPNMTVKENVAFPLTKGEPKDMVDELLLLTGLSMLGHRKIQTLSGGQQQRVALARAIAKKPKLLLLDEPLSAIDNAMREQLQDTLLQLHKRYGLTTILVSHDMDEIVRLSDRIIHLENGTVQEYRSPELFLNSMGNLSGLVGNVLSVAHNQDGNRIVVFVRNRILEIISTEKDTTDLSKGDKIKIVYDNDALPFIQRL